MPWSRPSEIPEMTPWQVIEEALAHMRPPRGAKWLADQLDEKIQTVSNWKARRVPPERYRDVAVVLGLTVDQVEGLEPLPWIVPAGEIGWPFSAELHQKVNTLSDEELHSLERVISDIMEMRQKALSLVANRGQLISAKPKVNAYAGSEEENSVGLPADMGMPPHSTNARSSQNPRSAHRKSSKGP